MEGAGLLLEILLVALLAATLFHALRLERALGVLKRDRGEMQALVDGFTGATRHAEAGIDRLRGAVDGAGRSVVSQIQQATTLQQDLGFLVERGEALADRLDRLVRAARPLDAPPRDARAPEPFARIVPVLPEDAAQEPPLPRVRSQAERDLMRALRRDR